MVLGNLASGHVSMRFGATGPNNSSVTACAAGAHSIGEAFHTIVRGAADVMIAGGTEAVITPLAVVASATCGRCHRMRRPLRRPVALTVNATVL